MAEIDQLLASYSFDPDEVWPLYKQQFLLRPPENRDMELQAFDAYCASKMDTPSRETAELLVRKRELLDLHGMLRKLGR